MPISAPFAHTNLAARYSTGTATVVYLAVFFISCSTPGGAEQTSDPSVESASKTETDGHDDAQYCLEIDLDSPQPTVFLTPVASIDKSIFERGMAHHRPHFKCCYQKMSDRRTHNFDGTIVLNLAIEEGVVRGAEIQQYSADPLDHDHHFARCIEEVAGAMSFPGLMSPDRAPTEQSEERYPHGDRPAPGYESGVPTVEPIRLVFPLRFGGG